MTVAVAPTGQDATGVTPCCTDGEMTLHLDEDEPKFLPSIKGVEVIHFGKAPLRSLSKCNRGVIVKATFEKSTCSGCHSPPECGRKMLQVDFDLDQTRGEYIFNVGDSVSNNGWAGDSSHQQNDAEVQAWNNYIRLFKSDKCLGSQNYVHAFSGQLIDSVSHVTLLVSNELIRIITDQGMDEQVCHECLFALNGQPDTQSGGVNEDVYVSLNRVVQWYSWRVGYGVCSATFRWVCPETFPF
ncbi:uncharacterized protein LOC110460937 isoform X2 [Mizuhopecten yessoensis]|uniref:uncharacterized protein LOC110460937 isoform X2 n=1 Tax=Mizuhopecten yessoensis TaxID=6573 RepID=UPI000B45F8AE|nr:uncharacterized protein LOC110460937 isoform X2 [Mizuhopecten yessoensis]